MTISTQNIACLQRQMYARERERERERDRQRQRDRQRERESMWHACVHVHMHMYAHVSQILLSCNHMLSQNTTICVHCRNYIVCHKTHTRKKKEKKPQTLHQQHMFSLSTCTNSHLPFTPKHSSILSQPHHPCIPISSHCVCNTMVLCPLQQ